MGEPPSETGAVHDTVAPPLMAVAVTAVGAPGFVILGTLAPAGTLATTVRAVTARNAGANSLRTVRPTGMKRRSIWFRTGLITPSFIWVGLGTAVAVKA